MPFDVSEWIPQNGDGTFRTDPGNRITITAEEDVDDPRALGGRPRVQTLDARPTMTQSMFVSYSITRLCFMEAQAQFGEMEA